MKFKKQHGGGWALYKVEWGDNGTEEMGLCNYIFIRGLNLVSLLTSPGMVTRPQRTAPWAKRLIHSLKPDSVLAGRSFTDATVEGRKLERVSSILK